MHLKKKSNQYSNTKSAHIADGTKQLLTTSPLKLINSLCALEIAVKLFLVLAHTDIASIKLPITSPNIVR